MKKEQKAFFQELQNTFDTPGWQHLKQGWTEEQQVLPEAMFFNAKTVEDIQAARIRYGLLTELITLPETLEEQRRQIEEDEKE